MESDSEPHKQCTESPKSPLNVEHSSPRKLSDDDISTDKEEQAAVPRGRGRPRNSTSQDGVVGSEKKAHRLSFEEALLSSDKKVAVSKKSDLLNSPESKHITDDGKVKGIDAVTPGITKDKITKESVTQEPVTPSKDEMNTKLSSKALETTPKTFSGKKSVKKSSKEAGGIEASPGLRPSIIQDQWLEPFKFGWRRELVLRSSFNEATPSGRGAADAYYFTPDGKKLRSLVEVDTYFEKLKQSGKESANILDRSNFTFAKFTIHREPEETVRAAAARLITSSGSGREEAESQPGTPLIGQSKRNKKSKKSDDSPDSPAVASKVKRKDGGTSVKKTFSLNALLHGGRRAEKNESFTPKRTSLGEIRLSRSSTSSDELSSSGTESKTRKRKNSSQDLETNKKIKVESDGMEVSRGKESLKRGLMPGGDGVSLGKASSGSNKVMKASGSGGGDGRVAASLCSLVCAGLLGVNPALPCKLCMCLYHPKCVGYGNSKLSIKELSNIFICAMCREREGSSTTTSKLRFILPSTTAQSTAVVNSPRMPAVSTFQSFVNGSPNQIAPSAGQSLVIIAPPRPVNITIPTPILTTHPPSIVMTRAIESSLNRPPPPLQRGVSRGVSNPPRGMPMLRPAPGNATIPPPLRTNTVRGAQVAFPSPSVVSPGLSGQPRNASELSPTKQDQPRTTLRAPLNYASQGVIMLPKSVVEKLDLSRKVALNVGGSRIVVHPSSFIKTENDYKVILPKPATMAGNMVTSPTKSANGNASGVLGLTSGLANGKSIEGSTAAPDNAGYKANTSEEKVDENDGANSKVFSAAGAKYRLVDMKPNSEKANGDACGNDEGQKQENAAEDKSKSLTDSCVGNNNVTSNSRLKQSSNDCNIAGEANHDNLKSFIDSDQSKTLIQSARDQSNVPIDTEDKSKFLLAEENCSHDGLSSKGIIDSLIGSISNGVVAMECDSNKSIHCIAAVTNSILTEPKASDTTDSVAELVGCNRMNTDANAVSVNTTETNGSRSIPLVNNTGRSDRVDNDNCSEDSQLPDLDKFSTNESDSENLNCGDFRASDDILPDLSPVSADTGLNNSETTEIVNLDSKITETLHSNNQTTKTSTATVNRKLEWLNRRMSPFNTMHSGVNIMSKIFRHLDTRSLCNAASVCRTWSVMAQQSKMMRNKPYDTSVQKSELVHPR